MPLAKVLSCAIVGLEGEIVECEVDVSRRGLNSLALVGLPDTAVKEAKDRVESAIKNSGFLFPNGRIIINLAPADLRKEGPTYDLPIAVGIMVAGGRVMADVTNCVFLGELSLDGAVRHTQGVLPMVALARDRGIRTAYVPAIDAAEAALVPDMTVYGVQNVGAVLNHLSGDEPLIPTASRRPCASSGTRAVWHGVDFSEIKGLIGSTASPCSRYGIPASMLMLPSLSTQIRRTIARRSSLRCSKESRSTLAPIALARASACSLSTAWRRR